MSEKKNQLLKASLLLFTLISLYYGVIYLLFPEFEINNSGSEPIPPGWVRWFGGIILSLSYGGFRLFRDPTKQGIFVKTIAIGTLLTALALFYSMIFEYDGIGDVLNTLIPAIVLSIISILFWISLRQSKELLW